MNYRIIILMALFVSPVSLAYFGYGSPSFFCVENQSHQEIVYCYGDQSCTGHNRQIVKPGSVRCEHKTSRQRGSVRIFFSNVPCNSYCYTSYRFKEDGTFIDGRYLPPKVIIAGEANGCKMIVYHPTGEIMRLLTLPQSKTHCLKIHDFS